MNFEINHYAFRIELGFWIFNAPRVFIMLEQQSFISNKPTFFINALCDGKSLKEENNWKILELIM